MHVPPGGITRISNWGVALCKRDVQSFIGVLYSKVCIGVKALPLYYWTVCNILMGYSDGVF